MAQFMNKKEDIVTEAIDGLIATSGGRLVRLDGYPHIRVVMRSDWNKSKVAIVSGGGAGHEPAHAGFVGFGMLAAAVCGDVFASPSVDAVLAAILAVTGTAGCLLIVKNYTGDRLNFGLAAERARALGLDVSMVIVDDDIALPDIAQSRGVAGTIFVHKIAGALADAGANLNTVTRAAEKVIEKTASIGMSLDTCTVPGSSKETRIPYGKAELGLGIHGEAGVHQVAYENAQAAMAMVVERLKQHMTSSQPYVALLNNLGGATVLEMQVLAYELARSETASRLKYIAGPAALMTSLNMRGFSVSIMPVTDDEAEALSLPTETPAWPGLATFSKNSTIELPDGLRPVQPTPSKHPATQELLTRCCKVFINSEKYLNSLDAKAGDGDTGTTLAGAARALIEAMDRLPLADHAQLYSAIGLELSETMGGSSGVLLAIFFAATGDAAVSGLPIRESLKLGLKRMQEIGGAEEGDRTMVDALKPALEALDRDLLCAAGAARAGANRTSEMSRARAGRSSYLNSEQLIGCTDPGAEAVARLFEALAVPGTI
ncbi:MAG: dihydroxyacetone kinase subunit DhaK [Rhodobacteraceae bacterium]|nr:dihydroxyacetone kinase subunit DhaK [Paracoccaceae bacterium]